MKLAVIPARGGSKRIPRKNIKLFGGKPMIAWSIEAAEESGVFDRIIVSTDNAEIASIAREYGAEVPFMRPDELSDDHTGTSPVIAHAIHWYVEHGFDPQHVCCIYATAPFIQSTDIQQGLEIIEKGNVDFAFSATSFPFPIQRAIKLCPDGSIKMFDPSKFNQRSQDLEEAYHDAGQFYWGTNLSWTSGQPIFELKSFPVYLPRYRVQDIDTFEDWKFAELLFETMKN
tara:strand:+ start:488 stop:1174 length:687 start_codon:yes stop_codon:yes gene_type:complete